MHTSSHVCVCAHKFTHRHTYCKKTIKAWRCYNSISRWVDRGTQNISSHVTLSCMNGFMSHDLIWLVCQNWRIRHSQGISCMLDFTLLVILTPCMPMKFLVEGAQAHHCLTPSTGISKNRYSVTVLFIVRLLLTVKFVSDCRSSLKLLFTRSI